MGTLEPTAANRLQGYILSAVEESDVPLVRASYLTAIFDYLLPTKHVSNNISTVLCSQPIPKATHKDRPKGKNRTMLEDARIVVPSKGSQVEVSMKAGCKPDHVPPSHQSILASALSLQPRSRIASDFAASANSHPPRCLRCHDHGVRAHTARYQNKAEPPRRLQRSEIATRSRGTSYAQTTMR